MKVSLRKLLIICCLLIGAGGIFRASGQGKRHNPVYDFSYLDSKITSWVDSGYYHGASVIIFRNNRLIYCHYYGDYNAETVAYIASAGKWLAAATIAAVVDEGKLSWDDPVQKWLPQFKDVKGKATLRQLLSHTSGYPDYQPQGKRPDNYQTLSESVAQIVNLPADTVPGAVFHYGGLAMQVAGRMAEVATGKSWAELFQEKIAGPLAMSATHFTPVSEVGGQNPMLGGGARASLQDYANFLNMISNKGLFKGKKVLSGRAIEIMQANQLGSAKVNPGEFVENVRVSSRKDIYGLGEWREEVDGKGRALLISSPSWAGAYPWIDKKNNVYGFFLARVDKPKYGFNAFTASPVIPLLVRDVLNVSRHCEIKHGYIITPDHARLYYEEIGQGQPLILIHGHSFDRTEWDPQFFALSRSFRVIRYDLRGYGWSSMPYEKQKALHADDLKALMDQLHIAKANIVGLSLGGFIATDFLALYPGCLLSVTAASGDFFKVPGPGKPWTSEEINIQLKKINEWHAKGSDANKKEWWNALTTRSGKPIANLRRPVWDMIYKWDAWQPQHIEPRFLLGDEVEEKLRAQHLYVPVMILTGAADAGATDKLLTVWRGARQVVIPHAGHVSNLENPDGFNNALTTFINAYALKK